MKIKFLEFKRYLASFFIKVAKHPFITGILLFIFSLLIGFFLFYKYNILFPRKIIDELESPILFREALYKKTLDFLEKERSDFLKAETKKYPNIFNVPDVPQDLIEDSANENNLTD